MKLERKQVGFQPVTLTLETPYEVAMIVTALGVMDTARAQRDVRSDYPGVVVETDKDCPIFESYNLLSDTLDEYREKGFS